MMHPDSYEDGSSVFNVQLTAFFFLSVINYLGSNLGEFLKEPKIAFTAN